jgi:hypothetical protein
MDRQTAQPQAIIGTPVEVPVPSRVIFIGQNDDLFDLNDFYDWFAASKGSQNKSSSFHGNHTNHSSDRFCNFFLDGFAQCGPDEYISQTILVQAQRKRANFFRYRKAPIDNEQPLFAEQAKPAIEISIFEPELNTKLVRKSFQFFE